MQSRCLSQSGSRLAREARGRGAALRGMPMSRRVGAQPVRAYLPTDAPSSNRDSSASSIKARMEAANAALQHDAMMCYQCEQTKNGTGCTDIGICGKTPEVAALQDLLIHCLKGLGSLAHVARTSKGLENARVNSFINAAIFSTLTNVNFSDDRFVDFVAEARSLHAELAAQLAAAGGSVPASETAQQPWFGELPHPLLWNSQAVPLGSLGEMLDEARKKAVAVLLTLLHLGVRNIRLGPRLPAFLTPEAVGVLVERFNLMPANVADPATDMKNMMACK
ncbi:hypothetical protein GPECTOR_263g677 [Gonium pectorale]|uniref:Hydroxylamine reductase n=1 Tax=Gonium pectorale TaxID=33097 RepID=A0A150FW89_GONPE|nr:hypothetical protein GPECTOR_263g677 [Gonium pectorale]|eukprot:KXZ41847.1 hypothetical protein GPECTOR_263g677 [Gonium pectorale]